MLEQLFGSRTRWKLLKTFLSHPEEKYYIRELTRITGEKLNSVRRELANLEDWGVVMGESTKDDKKVKITKSSREKKYFQADTSFVLFQELKDLIMKSWLLVERSLVKKIAKMGNIKLLILSGRFVDSDIETDVLIAGSVNREKLKKLMRSLGRSFGEDINYTVMTYKEYKYRRDITDKFLYRILESGHVKVLDRT